MQVSWGVLKVRESTPMSPGREEGEKSAGPGRGKIVQRTEGRFGGYGGGGKWQRKGWWPERSGCRSHTWSRTMSW